MKSINEQFPDNPLPSRSVGDGKMVIAACVTVCVIISVLTVIGVFSIDF